MRYGSEHLQLKFAMRLVFVVLACAVVFVQVANLGSRIDNAVFDVGSAVLRQYFPQNIDENVLVVGIDEEFLRSIPEPLTLGHAYLGKFLEAMAIAQPLSVGMDIVLPEKSFRFLTWTDHRDVNLDLLLLRGLRAAQQRTRLVLGTSWDPAYAGFRPLYIDFAASANHIASLMICPDDDGVLRRLPGTTCQPDGVPALYAAMADSLAQPLASDLGWVNFAIGKSLSYISLHHVLRDFDEKRYDKLRATFAHRMVLLGVILPYEDRTALPATIAAFEADANDQPGVLFHAQALRTVIHNATISKPDAMVGVILCLLGFCLLFVPRALFTMALYAGFVTLLLCASVVLLRHNIFLMTGNALLIGGLAAGSRTVINAWKISQEKYLLQQVFRGSVSPLVLEDILTHKIAPDLAGQSFRVCVLFADIRGFTALSENMHPKQVIELLNKYFAKVTKVIHKHHGTVDKFMGDGVMAFFGAPRALPSSEKYAISAACEMLQTVDQLNLELLDSGWPTIRIGIGLHVGEAVIGYLGSPEKNEYTAIGDTVNVASRLEGLTKEKGYAMLVSDDFACALGYPENLIDLQEAHLKGRAAMKVFGLADTKGK
jgi:class 3 adenylate cyclase/CHASE2 domain-containing sensor protein